MSDCFGKDRAEFGVLFVDGFRQQRPGSAIALLAAALYRWLFYWNARPDADPACLPSLSDVALSGAGGGAEDSQPAHLTLSVPLHLSTRDRKARWLLAESSWADLFTAPRFLGLARWIWKVSTCLLVLQFVTPMRRHLRAAKCVVNEMRRSRAAKLNTQLLRTLAAHGALAAAYLVLMGVAATLSVLLAVLLLVVALAAYLPIPRIDQAVRWVVVHISAMLGDSYMLAHCPVQFAAMRTQVAGDLAWLQERCDKVAVVAHSQGAALAHQVLKEGRYRSCGLRAFITLGQGISKFDILWRMDWDPHARSKAQASRILVTSGMACSGLPAVGLVIGNWANAAFFKTLTDLPWWPLLIAVGFTGIACGVIEATRAVCHNIENDLALPDATFAWSDYYSSADPVSNGRLAPDATKQENQPPGDKPLVLPTACHEVYNSGSVTFDHNGYLRNQDELLPSLLNDLVAAAYGKGADTNRPELVRWSDVIASSQRRRRLLHWLVAARIAAVALLATLIWADPGRILKTPMAQLMHLFGAPAGMSNDTAVRLLPAALITAAFYTAAVIAWRAAVRHSVRLFFHDTPFATTATRSDSDVPPRQAPSAATPPGPGRRPAEVPRPAPVSSGQAGAL
jgi:hypothetical protein